MHTHPMRHLKPPENAEDGFQEWSRRRIWVAVVVMGALFMEPEARAKLFQETWQGFQVLCPENVAPALVPRCREQARFLTDFPECDEACHRQVAPFLGASR
jgi:hypothetical protein